MFVPSFGLNFGLTGITIKNPQTRSTLVNNEPFRDVCHKHQVDIYSGFDNQISVNENHIINKTTYVYRVCSSYALLE